MKSHLKTLNWPAFLISAYFVCYGLMSISESWYIKAGMLIVGLFVEYQAQEVWGLSFAYKDARKKYKWLQVVFIWYIVIFALTSGIGFLLTEINTQGEIVQQVKESKANIQSQIDRLNRDIDGLTKQRDQEGATGTGERYRFLQTEIDRKNAELKPLLKQRDKVSDKVQSKNMYVNIEQETGIPKVWLIAINFGSALAMVYLGLALRPMTVDVKTLETNNNTSDKVVTPPPPLYTELQTKNDTEDVPSESLFKVVPTINNDKVLSIKQQKLIELAKHVYGDNPNRLNGLMPAWQKLKNTMDVTYRECASLMEELNDIGAIDTTQGISKANWPLEKTIEYIKEKVV